tara:strand:+ start:2771 stop:3496 length:726 start_codon:yes stop_codon:yes gene_type:complete
MFARVWEMQDDDDDEDVIEILPSTSASARTDLYVSRTILRDAHGARYHFWGLYCDNDLSAGDFIGMYNGTWISSGDNFPFGNRYALTLSHGMTVSPPGQRPDPRGYPVAMANEPVLHSTANANMQEWTFGPEHVEHIPIQHRGESRFYGVALVACVDIPRNTEIKWHYGPNYSRNYGIGAACSGELTSHPCDALGHKLPFDAVSPALSSPSNSDDDDPSYGRVWPAQERVVHLNSCSHPRG